MKDKKNCNCNIGECSCEMPQATSIAPDPTPVIRVKIIGNAFVVTSVLKYDVIKTLEKYDNNSLCLKTFHRDEEVEIFRIGLGKTASISKSGITFAEADKDGYATATMLFPDKVVDKKEFIKEHYGKTLYLLQETEVNAKHTYRYMQETYAKLDDIIKEI